jgi:hypothetical protein
MTRILCFAFCLFIALSARAQLPAGNLANDFAVSANPKTSWDGGITWHWVDTLNTLGLGQVSP